jgi:hypothetical protein
MKKTITKAFSLNEEEVRIIHAFAKEKGLSYSSAIRLIIREWAEMKKQYVTVRVNGFVDDAGNVQYSDAPADRED